MRFAECSGCSCPYNESECGLGLSNSPVKVCPHSVQVPTEEGGRGLRRGMWNRRWRKQAGANKTVHGGVGRMMVMEPLEMEPSWS